MKASRVLVCLAVLTGSFRAVADEGVFAAFAASVERGMAHPTMSTDCSQSLRALSASAEGHAVLPTDEFFPEPLMRQLLAQFPSRCNAVIHSPNGGRAGEVVGDDDPKRFLGDAQLAPFREYLSWLVCQVNRALPVEEQVQMFSAELRVSRPGAAPAGIPYWHQDPKYLVASVSLLGPGTEFLGSSPRGEFLISELRALIPADVPYQQTPRGQTLVFSCAHRQTQKGVAPTLHRSPRLDADRLLILVRYTLDAR